MDRNNGLQRIFYCDCGTSNYVWYPICVGCGKGRPDEAIRADKRLTDLAKRWAREVAAR